MTSIQECHHMFGDKVILINNRINNIHYHLLQFNRINLVRIIQMDLKIFQELQHHLHLYLKLRIKEWNYLIYIIMINFGNNLKK
jgi:hypothetical protein